MDPLLIVMRLLHVISGVFWAGTMIFVAFFLFPSVRDAGPEGGKVVAELTRRRFTEIVPVIALISILSGLWLYWRGSAGFLPMYMSSGTGMTYGTGGAAAILSLLIGMTVVRPSMKRAAQLAAAGKPDDVRMAQIQGLRARAGKGGQIVAVLLLIAVAAMAIGRYVGT